ncbi:hypothetical protein [Photobacterium iliopiscarium]|nr:hypothetical protein [Photobacterium iliopiscarium]
MIIYLHAQHCGNSPTTRHQLWLNPVSLLELQLKQPPIYTDLLMKS